MGKKLLGLLNREFVHLNQAAFLLGFFALFSQVLGLVRDKLLAHFLGPSASLDIYYAAFRIPDFLYASVASLVSITVLIPFLSSLASKAGEEKEAAMQKFLNEIFTVFLLTMVAASTALFMLMPFLADTIAPGFTAAAQSKLVLVARIMLLSPIFLGLSNLFGTVTQLFKKFFVYALSPILYNLGIISGILFFYPLWGVYGLALGVVVGALLHFSIQFLVVTKYHFVPRLTRRIDMGRLKKVVYLSLPRTLTLSLTNLIFLVFISLASTINEGSISIFSFSYNLQSVPLGLIGISYSVAVFPSLVTAYAAEDKALFCRQIIDACRQIVFWSLPIIFLFIVLRAQIVRVILGSGRFSWADTRLTAAALGIFAVSILAQSLILILIRGYYAAGNTRKPLLINLVSALVTVGLGFGLVQFFNESLEFRAFIRALLRVDDIPNAGILMLPLAFSVGNILNFCILWWSFKRDHICGRGFSFQETFLKSLTASFSIGLTAYVCLAVFGRIFDLNSFHGIFFQGFFSGIIGIAVGAVFLWLMRSQEFERILAAFIRRLRRDKGAVLEQTRL